LFSQDRKDEISITEVTVQGNLATSKNTIIFTAGLRKGQNVSISDFPRAVKRLWQLGLFQDVQIKIDEETSEGLSIIIEVKENWRARATRVMNGVLNIIFYVWVSVRISGSLLYVDRSMSGIRLLDQNGE